MNVATSSNTSAMSGMSDIASNQTSSSTGSKKTSDKSFKEEMKTASKSEESKDTKEVENSEKNNQKDNKVSDKDSKNSSEKTSAKNKDSDEIVTSDMLKSDINFTDYKYHNEGQSILSQNIQNLLNTKDIMNNVNSALTIDYDVINMSDDDANFFANLVQNTDMSMRNVANQMNNALVENSGNIQKNIQVSSVLMEKLANSLKTNQPFRIDFDKDISVIIKVNKDGSLSANFIPGDKAVEQYLRNNIENLKQRFDEENLPYSELSYSNHKNGRQQQNKKENDNE